MNILALDAMKTIFNTLFFNIPIPNIPFIHFYL